MDTNMSDTADRVTTVSVSEFKAMRAEIERLLRYEQFYKAATSALSDAVDLAKELSRYSGPISDRVIELWKSQRDEIERLRDKNKTLQLKSASEGAVIAMAVDRLEGLVEGRPTHRGNFLQRIDELRQIESENARLRAIVGRLPKTADGVPVVPGMVYWFEYTNAPGEFSNDFASDIYNAAGETEFDKDCYSTREAAEAARANAGA